MKKHLESLLSQSIDILKTQDVLTPDIKPVVYVERTRDAAHGDFASNIALILAKTVKMNPRQLAEKMIAVLPEDSAVTKVEIAGAGFINFFMNTQSLYQVISEIQSQGKQFGHNKIGAGKKVLIEFVSANPTGPLHVGHGRGAAYGSALANLMEACGFEVSCEYYVNDAGRQMDILATSVWLRYLEISGEVFVFPTNGYRGNYVKEIAQTLFAEQNKSYCHPTLDIFADLPADEPQGGDKEIYIDAVIQRAKTLLGLSAYRHIFELGLNVILDDIRDDLQAFGVHYAQWFSEQQLVDNKSVSHALAVLKHNGYLYEHEGATWFASSQLGDEKDRVVIRDNGQYTYFASDIAYHWNKLERGFDLLIDMWGADHHGYIARVEAALTAMGVDKEKLKVLLVQFVTLWRHGEKAQMSTRTGEFVTLRELRNDVGNDATRFFYLMQRSEQHIDFDLDLAIAKSNDNPVFYVQYAHARVCSVFAQLKEKNLMFDVSLGMQNLLTLTAEHEMALLTTLSRYPEMLERATLQYEPHQVIRYLRELAADFHTYYNAYQFLVENEVLRCARLTLVLSVKQVLSNGLSLLGISAPEVM